MWPFIGSCYSGEKWKKGVKKTLKTRGDVHWERPGKRRVLSGESAISSQCWRRTEIEAPS